MRTRNPQPSLRELLSAHYIRHKQTRRSVESLFTFAVDKLTRFLQDSKAHSKDEEICARDSVTPVAGQSIDRFGPVTYNEAHQIENKNTV